MNIIKLTLSPEDILSQAIDVLMRSSTSESAKSRRYRKAIFLRQLKAPGSVFLTSSLGSDVVGLAWGSTCLCDRTLGKRVAMPGVRDVVSKDAFMIDGICVLPPLRRKGIGASLIQGLVSQQQYKRVLISARYADPMFRLAARLGAKTILKHNDRVLMALDRV